MRLAVALVLIARVAAADPAKDSKKVPDPPPDPLAQNAADEANLESIAPREGFTMSFAFGGAMMLGGDGGVGTGGMVTARIGHVATPNTIITFELTGGSTLHSVGMTPNKETLRNDDGNVMWGAQYYAAPSLWLRGAGGLGVYTRRDPGVTKTYPGPAGGIGVGVDLFRRRYLVLGLEAFTIGKIARDGMHTSSAFCIGISYY